MHRKPKPPEPPPAKTTQGPTLKLELFPPKPTTKTWACRVKLKWQVGPRTGVHEGTYDIEAATEAAAMGRAIFEAQSHLKARTLAGTNPTWVKTDVKCS